jgi:hypothetical protein
MSDAMGKNDGGQAFPAAHGGTSSWHNGMSLRDWFAGQALAGIIAAQYDQVRSRDAEEAYQYADAMLATRIRQANGEPHDE